MAQSTILPDRTVPRLRRRRLRSTQRGNFAVVTTRTMMADGAFAVAGPAAWNALPPELRNATSRTMFLTHLKTYLYNNHFNNIL